MRSPGCDRSDVNVFQTLDGMEVVGTAEGRIASFVEAGAVTETPEIAVSRAEGDILSRTSRERAAPRPSGDISEGPQHVQCAAGRQRLACGLGWLLRLVVSSLRVDSI